MKSTGKDHRTRVTKMLIRKAFTDLLKEKPLKSCVKRRKLTGEPSIPIIPISTICWIKWKRKCWLILLKRWNLCWKQRKRI